MIMLKKLFKSIQDCPILPFYFILGFFSRTQTLSLTQADNSAFSAIFNKYHSDKSSLHCYDLAYSLIFSSLRNDALNVLEVGIGSNNPSIPFNMGISGSIGASLFAWREYFPNASIYGADIDSACMFEAPRIKTFIVDQLSFKSVKRMANLISDGQNEFFDACIDDGYHSFGANRRTYLALRSFLRSRSTYVIEDVSPWMELAWKGFSLLHSVSATVYKFPIAKQPLLMIVLTE